MTDEQRATARKPAKGTGSDGIELANLVDELRIARAQIVSLQHDNVRARGEAAAASAESGRLKQQLRALQSSSSWRITRPIRAARRATIGRGRI